ncbi:MAG TPA: hypothetical protein VF556_16980 [Pyrinomonadaceae bacterium]|jgi:hypothetical protein
MKKYFFIVVLFTLFFAQSTFAQKTFLLKGASKTYDVKITIAKCEKDICEGKATVFLMKKNQTTPFQTVRMPNLYLELGDDRKPTANLIELYGMNNSGVVFEDFNFDGADDLALRNGNEGAYGGPSYDILLFSKARNNFLINRELSELASSNLGLFDVDKKNKTIETFTKSGCCWHQTTRYRVINNRPKKVYAFTEDATAANDKVILTTETLNAGKWRKTKKTVLRKDYYNEQQ